ncbi:hypothetical protein KEM48_002819 [Puccinia striiformis f. sp. tritici PST-130]|nr:hypothetical protein KEM48_002819 [Puccinia striiformis f. sp. tritici PST-130]
MIPLAGLEIPYATRNGMAQSLEGLVSCACNGSRVHEAIPLSRYEEMKVIGELRMKAQKEFRLPQTHTADPLLHFRTALEHLTKYRRRAYNACLGILEASSSGRQNIDLSFRESPQPGSIIKSEIAPGELHMALLQEEHGPQAIELLMGGTPIAADKASQKSNFLTPVERALGCKSADAESTEAFNQAITKHLSRSQAKLSSTSPTARADVPPSTSTDGLAAMPLAPGSRADQLRSPSPKLDALAHPDHAVVGGVGPVDAELAPVFSKAVAKHLAGLSAPSLSADKHDIKHMPNLKFLRIVPTDGTIHLFHSATPPGRRPTTKTEMTPQQLYWELLADEKNGLRAIKLIEENIKRNRGHLTPASLVADKSDQREYLWGGRPRACFGKLIRKLSDQQSSQ